MCNGHSACTEDSKKCDQPCLHNTEGEHCEKCAQGYFGVPVNGGRCEGMYITLRSLLDERFILSEQGSKFLENQLSEQAELSEQGE